MRAGLLPGLAGAAIAAAAVLSGCGTAILPGTSGSGLIVESEPAVEPFSGLDVSSAIEATLRLGDTPAVVLRADDNIIDRLTASVEDDVLVLDVEGSVRDATLQAEVTVPADLLELVELSGAATLTGTQPLSPSELILSLTGASRTVLVLDTPSLSVEADGASVVNASGAAETLDVRASGASSVRLEQLSASVATVDASGASTVRVLVSDELVAEASGSSSVRVGGDPEVVESSTSGASTIEAE